MVGYHPVPAWIGSKLLQIRIKVKHIYPYVCLSSPCCGSIVSVWGEGMKATDGKLFGKRVRAARKAAKLSLEEVAEKADSTYNHLSQIERGTRRPSFKLIFALARVLGVSALNFFIFDAEDTDARAVRRRVTSALENCNIEELLRVDRFIKFVLRP